MIIARAPVRISLAGGGTDLEAYYGKYGGMVVSTTIDKYFYAFVNADGRDNIQVTSSDYHTFYRTRPGESFLWGGDLALPRAILDHFGVRRGVSMFLASEVPPGTGLGSSGAVAVALSKAVAALCGRFLPRGELAELACIIEIEKLGMPIGKQDQYAATFGGLNCIVFTKEEVTVEPLRLPGTTLEALQRRLMLFFMGSSRKSSSILRYQKRATEEDDERVLYTLHAIKELGLATKEALEKGDLRAVGELLGLSWKNKRTLVPHITNSFIDDCYAAAKAAGAVGGKITGAGGGGFLMLYCEEPDQARVTEVLEEKGPRRMDFRFENGGAQILINTGLRIKGD